MFLDVGKPILGEALPMAHALHVNCEFYGTNCCGAQIFRPSSELIENAGQSGSSANGQNSARMVKIFDRFEKARLAASTSLFGLPSPPAR